MPANNTDIEECLWDAADELRANSRPKASKYSVPVLGLIFLRYADHRFAHVDHEFQAAASTSRRHTVGPLDYQALCQTRDLLPPASWPGRWTFRTWTSMWKS